MKPAPRMKHSAAALLLAMAVTLTGCVTPPKTEPQVQPVADTALGLGAAETGVFDFGRSSLISTILRGPEGASSCLPLVPFLATGDVLRYCWLGWGVVVDWLVAEDWRSSRRTKTILFPRGDQTGVA